MASLPVAEVSRDLEDMKRRLPPGLLFISDNGGASAPKALVTLFLAGDRTNV